MPDQPLINPDPNRARSEEAREFGAAQYKDVIGRLTAEGLPCHFTQTGGMNAALEVTLEGGRVLLITDAEDSLSWYREEQRGWGVGLYATDDASDGPLRFASSAESSIDALLQLLTDVLFRSPTSE